MFLLGRPTEATIQRHVDAWRDLPLTSGEPGILTTRTDLAIDESAVVLGRGAEVYARARHALEHWQQFDLGWVEVRRPERLGEAVHEKR